LTLFFFAKRSYKDFMNKKMTEKAANAMTTPGKGPWDSPDGEPGKIPASKGGKKGPVHDLPTGEENAGDQKGPRNPWDPIPIDGGKAGKKPRGPSLEDLLRRAGGGGGGNGWGGMPRRSGGRSIWPLVIAGFALLWLVFTSFHRLEPAQSGVVTTFGKYSRTVGSGISMTWPAPIERLQKVDTGQVRTITIGTPDSTSENLVLTRDQNVIDMAYNVRWKITDPERYLFQLDNPDETVAEVAESAMRAAVANFDLIQAIGTGRGDIQADVRNRMNKILDGYRAGMRVQSIDIQQAAAPAEVRQAFGAVNAARQEREGNLNAARKYARQVTERALGETAEFDKIYVQYSAAPVVTKRRLYYETMENVLRDIDKTIVETGNVTPFLPLPEFKGRSAAATEVVAEGKKP
jgi:modulator of FtsH protease HflK